MKTESGRSLEQVLSAFIAKTGKDADAAMDDVADEFLMELKSTLNRPGTGRTYRRRRVRHRMRGRRQKASDFHVASAPGQPPAPDTANLLRSAYKARTGPRSREVGVNTPYADDLEYGTRRMKPRPYLRVSAAAAKVRMNLRMQIALKQSVRA